MCVCVKRGRESWSVCATLSKCIAMGNTVCVCIESEERVDDADAAVCVIGKSSWQWIDAAATVEALASQWHQTAASSSMA